MTDKPLTAPRTKLYRDQINFIRERLGLCPIEEIIPGESQVRDRAKQDRQEMTLERFIEKWGKEKKIK